MSLRDVPVTPGKVAPRVLTARAPVPDLRNPSAVGRTVTLSSGGGATGTAVAPRRRSPRSVGERVVGSPDRLAMWAFVMAVFLVLVATLSAH